MAIPKLKKQNIIDALKFIDENGVPEHNTSVKYVLVFENGKKYPPKYVVAVADHLANGTDISTESFDSVDARNYLEKLGFSIETKQQEKFELSITAESVQSTDERFTMDPIIKLVTYEDNSMPFAEERRLFYVAMTRTKNRVYIAAPKTKPSRFLVELIKDFKEVHLYGAVRERTYEG